MNTQSNSWASWTWLGLGYAFLYVPIVLLIIFSFNESRLVTVWAGFSTKWYVELFKDARMLDGALLSLKLAFLTATTATVLGTMAALLIVRFRFAGKTLFGGLVTAPMVMPEVITGLSLLLLFVWLQQLFQMREGFGFTGLWISHVTFSVAFTTVAIAARLREMDLSLEEAAMALGASPLKTFFVITLPIISPALVSAWLLGFTLSVDDLVISSFVAGPGSTTLPMIVYSSVRLGVSPKINALATLIVALVTLGVTLAGIWMYRQEKKREREIAQAFSDANTAAH